MNRFSRILVVICFVEFRVEPCSRECVILPPYFVIIPRVPCLVFGRRSQMSMGFRRRSLGPLLGCFLYTSLLDYHHSSEAPSPAY